jgi:hypothetical protein
MLRLCHFGTGLTSVLTVWGDVCPRQPHADALREVGGTTWMR